MRFLLTFLIQAMYLINMTFKLISDMNTNLRFQIRCGAGRNIWTMLMFGVVFCGLMIIGPVTSANASAFQDPGSRTGGSGGGGGDLIPVQPNVDGGQISIGASAQVVVLFRNDSGQPITTGPIQLYPSSTVTATVALNQCELEPLPSGAVCAISLEVKGLSAGNWRLEMLMRHDGRSRLVTATVSGRVEAGEGARDRFVSDLESTPADLNFGTIQNNQPSVRGLVLRNVTSTAIEVHSVYIEAAQQSGFSLRTDCGRLEPGQACMVTVTWSPVLEGATSGVLLVEHTGPTSIASVPLTGTFNPSDTAVARAFPKPVPGKGLLVASQNDIDFGGNIATTSAITVSLVNAGDAPLTLREIMLANGENGLSIARNGCRTGMVLEPVEACPLTLSWSPVREGSIIDDVQVYHSGARGIAVLPVRGSASRAMSHDGRAMRMPDVASGGTQGGQEFIQIQHIDPSSALDGFIVTSHSPTRSIITGPGGSRIVYNGEEVVVGGFLWNVNIRQSGVEFHNGPNKVLLLFDRSLSSVNRNSGQ